MQIRIGYELTFDCAQPTPMMLMLNVHPSRAHDLLSDDTMTTEPAVPVTSYRDVFDNICLRLVAPKGPITLRADALVTDTGELDEEAPGAMQHAVEDLPDEVLVYLLGSRYCETDRLSDFAWNTFGHLPMGWARVAGIVKWVNEHVTFGYQYARATKTAYEAFEEKRGVCRDFAHLATTLCRCMNIPARYCTGYLGDIGVPVSPDPMDWSGWFEAYLGGRWYTFDARHNRRRIGRILIGHGRDASDVAISNTFGRNTLTGFKVVTDEVKD